MHSNSARSAKIDRLALVIAILLVAVATGASGADPVESDGRNPKTAAAALEPVQGAITFSAVGCGPYNPVAKTALIHFIKQENAENSSEFLIHLGDIVTGAISRLGLLNDTYYARMRTLLTGGSTIPTYIVPGDNEWNDRPDPETGWKLWSAHLLNLHETIRPAWKTETQEERPENFAFVHKGVLFIGINLVGGRIHDTNEWATRFRQNHLWIARQFIAHKEDVRAAVIFCQANPIGFGKTEDAVNKKFAAFNAPFAQLAGAFAKPILFLHSDGHRWLHDKPWADAPNVQRVQIDLIDPKFPPLQVTVETTGKEMFTFNRRLKLPAWFPAGVEPARPRPAPRPKSKEQPSQ